MQCVLPLVFGLLMIGCLPSTSSSAQDDPDETDQEQPMTTPPPPQRLVAVGPGPSLVLLDPDSEQLVASAPLPRAPSHISERSPGEFLVSLPATEEEEGQVLAFSVDPTDALQQVGEVGKTQGEVAIYGTSWGALAISSEPSPRYRNWAFEGPVASSTACPLPLSVLLSPQDQQSSELRALLPDAGSGAELLDEIIQVGSAPSCARTLIQGLPNGMVPAALFQSEHLGLAAIATAGEQLTIACLNGPNVSALLPLPVPSQSPVSVKVIDDSFETVRLAVLQTKPSGLAIVTASAVTADPPSAMLHPIFGTTQGGERFEPERLAVAQGRVFVASSAGVFILREDGGLTLLDASLGAPLATVHRAGL